MNTSHHRAASLFVGRWQPFHKGHKALIETVLKQGKPVVIAIRDTPVDVNNPYSTTERWSFIQEALRAYGQLVKIVVIPDIDEICYGRDVGYGIRKIELDKEATTVSGTAIRQRTIQRHPILWLTGQSGAGKTTLARALKQEVGGLILDGDEMRQTISVGLGFSPEDREEHNLRVARLAAHIAREQLVIVSVIAPFAATRQKIQAICTPHWVYVERDVPITIERPYEIPTEYSVKLNADRQTTQEQVAQLRALLDSLCSKTSTV